MKAGTNHLIKKDIHSTHWDNFTKKIMFFNYLSFLIYIYMILLIILLNPEEFLII